MTTFVINQGPYQRGFKPKNFFKRRKRMMDLSAMQSDGGMEYSNEFESNHIQKEIKEEDFHPVEKCFFEILPWTLFVGLLFYTLIM